MIVSLVLILGVTSDFKTEPVLGFFFDLRQLLTFLWLFLLFFHLILFLLFIDLLNFFSFEFLLLFLLLHFLIELFLVLFTIKDVFLFDMILHDQDFFNLFEEFSLYLSHSLLYRTAWTGELFAAFLGKLFCINTKNIQSAYCCYMLSFASVFCFNHNVFVLYCFFLLLLFRGFLFFRLFDFLLNCCDVFLFEIWVILCHFCRGKLVQDFNAWIRIFTIFAQLEWETAS